MFDTYEETPYFEKGSLIKLENGECKKVEDLNHADFETVSSDVRFLSISESFYFLENINN